MKQHNLSNDELRAQMDAEARVSEAAALDEDDGAPLPPHVKVSRPNRKAPARGKVLQVRLNDSEMEALERVAERRGLAVSTLARAQLLELTADVVEVSDPAQEFDAVADRLWVLVAQMRTLVTAPCEDAPAVPGEIAVSPQP